MSKSYLDMDIFEITGKDTIDLLTSNAVKCLVCGKTIESKHQHDFRCCGCSNETFVDGGLSYVRVGAVDLDKVEDLSERHTYTKEEYYELKRKQKERDEKAFDSLLIQLIGE